MGWDDILKKTITDIREDFMMANKKAIIDFVLQDPAFITGIQDDTSPFQVERKEIGNSFRPAFDYAKFKMERNLHVINPCLSVLLDIWYGRFRYELFKLKSI